MAVDPGFVEFVIEQLEPVGVITHKGMFGGHGIWESGDMFALISSDSTLYFKVDDVTRTRYQEAGSEQFMTMPYWSVPADLLEDRGELLEWAEDAVAVGHTTAKKKR
jgi:DNA transformation protein and related proteins